MSVGPYILTLRKNVNSYSNLKKIKDRVFEMGQTGSFLTDKLSSRLVWIIPHAY